MTVVKERRTLTAQEAEERKVKREEAAVRRKAKAEERKRLLADLRFISCFPSLSSADERWVAAEACFEASPDHAQALVMAEEPDDVRLAAIGCIEALAARKKKPADGILPLEDGVGR